VALREGRKKAKLADFTQGTVAINEATRCAPNQANVARYRELQTVQDRLSLALRGVFADQRKLA
jgi:xylulokinase